MKGRVAQERMRKGREPTVRRYQVSKLCHLTKLDVPFEGLELEDFQGQL
jgi:hypothetical protein